MGFALVSLMAYMLASTLVIYCIALLLFGRKLTAMSKFVGFIVALPSAAITALILAPESSVVSAETMTSQGAAVGALIGLVVILAIGKRKAEAPSNPDGAA